jgi:Zn-finger nucleic acid-binding protein
MWDTCPNCGANPVIPEARYESVLKVAERGDYLAACPHCQYTWVHSIDQQKLIAEELRKRLPKDG